MGERYFVRGVQLGELAAYINCGEKQRALELLQHIEDEQFLWLMEDSRDSSKKTPPTPPPEKTGGVPAQTTETKPTEYDPLMPVVDMEGSPIEPSTQKVR